MPLRRPFAAAHRLPRPAPSAAALAGLTFALAAAPAASGSAEDAPARPAAPAAGDPTAGGSGTPSETAFTYQGELTQGGGPATGAFAMSFTLWTAETGGSQLGGPLSFPAVDVADGRFTVALDFGVDALRGGPSWLEITVEGFTLVPRQPITASPFAVRTRGIDVDGAGRVGIGAEASDQAQLSVGSGGPPAIRAVSETGGRVELATPAAALTSTAADPDGWAAILEGWSQLGERAFVGRDDIVTAREFFGVEAPVDSGYGGMYVSTPTVDGWPFYGYATDDSPRAWTTWNSSVDQWQLYVAGVPRLRVDETAVRNQYGVPMPVAVMSVSEGGALRSYAGPPGVDVELVFLAGGEEIYRVDFPPGVLGDDPIVHLTTRIDSQSSPLVPGVFVGFNDQIFVYLADPNDGDYEQSAFSMVVWPDLD